MVVIIVGVVITVIIDEDEDGLRWLPLPQYEVCLHDVSVLH